MLGRVVSILLIFAPGSVFEMIVIARCAKRAVAIQLDCFVVPPSGTSRNDRIRRLTLNVPNYAQNSPPGSTPARGFSFTSGDARIDVVVAVEVAQSDKLITHWIKAAAEAVTGYYGHFPVERLAITVAPRKGEAVNSGTEYEGRRIVIHLDPGARAGDLDDDWMLVHEMFHLGFPKVSRRYHYLEEGLSDYLEPLARARVGQLDASRVWHDYVEGINRVAHKIPAQGLDGTHDWAQVYWGGCLFWLLVDIDIRERSDNKRCLDDAIRAIVHAGGTGGTEWSLEQIVAIGDGATGTGSIRRIHDQFGASGGDPQLDSLWNKLGIHLDGRNIEFDNTAPLSALRQAITQPADQTQLSPRVRP